MRSLVLAAMFAMGCHARGPAVVVAAPTTPGWQALVVWTSAQMEPHSTRYRINADGSAVVTRTGQDADVAEEVRDEVPLPAAVVGPAFERVARAARGITLVAPAAAEHDDGTQLDASGVTIVLADGKLVVPQTRKDAAALFEAASPLYRAMFSRDSAATTPPPSAVHGWTYVQLERLADAAAPPAFSAAVSADGTWRCAVAQAPEQRGHVLVYRSRRATGQIEPARAIALLDKLLAGVAASAAGPGDGTTSAFSVERGWVAPAPAGGVWTAWQRHAAILHALCAPPPR